MEKQTNIVLKSETQRKIKSFSYALAWLNFIGIVGIAIYEALKGKEPPKREDYFR